MSKRQEPTTRFGRYLRQLMDANGFETNADLAAAISAADPALKEFNQSLISKWQSGGATPMIDTLRRVAPVLRVRLGDLLVEAELATPEELGMVGKPIMPPAPKLDPALKRPASLLADPNIPDAAKAHLRTTLKGAVDFWFDQIVVAGNAHEPSASERAAGRKVTPPAKG